MPARVGQPGSESQRAASVRTAGAVPQQLLLPVPTGDGGEPGADAAVGRVASGASGLWQPQVDGAVGPGGFGGESQARGAAAAVDGDRGDLCQATDRPAGSWPPNLSASVARFGGDGAGSSLVFGHHVCADGHGLHVSGGGDGLVESLGVGLAVKQHAGGGLLCGRLGSGAASGPAGSAGFKHRSRLAVHPADV